MTQYAGGKSRIGKKIYQAIKDYELKVIGNNESPYFEPFVGMGGVLQHFAVERSRPVYACDKEECIVSFWRGIRDGWAPRVINKEQYHSTKKNGCVGDPMYAFTAFGCSFRGMKWGGFFEDSMNRASRRILKNNFHLKMRDVQFIDAQSFELHDVSGHTIYCDPPYIDSSFDSRKNNLLGFSSEVFWETVRRWSASNIVIVSERSAPDDFIPIWSYERKNGINNDMSIVEKLFVLPGQ